MLLALADDSDDACILCLLLHCERGIIFEGKEKSGLQFFLLVKILFRSEIEQTHFVGLSFSDYRCLYLVLLSIGLFCDYDFHFSAIVDDIFGVVVEGFFSFWFDA